MGRKAYKTHRFHRGQVSEAVAEYFQRPRLDAHVQQQCHAWMISPDGAFSDGIPARPSPDGPFVDTTPGDFDAFTQNILRLRAGLPSVGAGCGEFWGTRISEEAAEEDTLR
jgi:hypothetical protein